MQAKTFSLGQKIIIIAIEVSATVRTRREDFRGWTYLVDYWFDGKRHEEWVYPDELAEEVS